MRVLAACKPEKVFYYFEEICKIPHGSGNVEGISNYLADFAKAHQLGYIQDEWKNIIIFKKASTGYEEEPTVILQGHMDMVAVKKPDCDIDMRTEGLRLAVDGDKVYAEGTSLGGDDGIAVAYALALLDDESLCHPALEIIITVDEEVGMDGARAIDLSSLKGHRMINLDSEEEGIFLTSCAGGARVDCHMPVHMIEMEGIAYEVEVDGLQGGHSGAEIHKGRANANCVMARLLNHLKEHCKIGIAGLDGGLADNAIPRQTKAVLVVPKAEDAAFAEILDAMTDRIAAELAVRDPEFKVHACETGKGSFLCLSAEDTAKCAQWLYGLPNGVQAMSVTMPGLVETSLNLGILQLKKEIAKAAEQDVACSCRTENAETSAICDNGTVSSEIVAQFSVRSSVETAKQALIEKLKALTALAGGYCEVRGDYPGWEYRVESPLRDKMVAVYRELYGKEPAIEAIHAGLECGLLGSKIDNLDCISMGPDMKNIHTTEESLSIASVERVWEYLVKVLERKDSVEK